MEGFDRLDRAIDRRFQMEDAFIQAMVLEFQRIQTQLNECIARHPEDQQLARLGEDFAQLGEQSRAIVPYNPQIRARRQPTLRRRVGQLGMFGGKRTRRCRKT